MTDNEIIKALGLCCEEDKCPECPYDFACYDDKYKNILAKDALDLINRLKAEIERLTEEDSNSRWKLLYKLALREKEVAYEGCRNRMKTAKSEAIKEFAERVKNECEGGWLEIEESVFDNLVKEMTEGNDEKSL